MCSLPLACAGRCDGNRAVLVVDIDALLGLDSIIEALFALVRAKPSVLWRLPGWLAGGSSSLRDGLPREAPAHLLEQACRADVLAYLRSQRSAGRSLGLIGDDDQQAA